MAVLSEVLAMFDVASGRASMEVTKKMFFVNQGSRLLDRLSNHHHARSRVIEPLSQGQHKLILPTQVRSIHHSYIKPYGTYRVRMTECEPTYIYTLYPDLTDSAVWGTPEWWALEYGAFYDVFGKPAADVPIEAALTDDYARTRADSRTIILGPPPGNASAVLELHCSIYTPALNRLNEINFWSENFADALVYAAMYVHDAILRNDEGAKGWMLKAQGEVNSYLLDQVEMEVTDMPTTMEG